MNLLMCVLHVYARVYACMCVYGCTCECVHVHYCVHVMYYDPRRCVHVMYGAGIIRILIHNAFP